MENCRTTKNGVKIYTYKNDRSHGFFISLFVKAGSMYESAEENGITHADILFCGDDYGVGGNDEQVYLSDIDFVKVDDYRRLAEYLAPLLED